MMIRFPRYWLTQLLLSLEVLITVIVIGWLEPSSLTAKAIQDTGPGGWVLLLAIGVCCVLTIFDVVINDLCPSRFRLPFAQHWRHLGLLGMGMMLSMLGMLIAFSHGHSPILYAYWLDAIFAVSLAYLDIFNRYLGTGVPV